MAFGYYASITVDNTKVGGSSGSLSNYPVLVSGVYDGTGDEPDLRTTGNGGNVQNANGYDIYFYDDASQTTKYDHEILYYNASTGEFKAWVRIPTLSKSADTTFYMFYGDSGISTDPSTTGTWNSDFQLVSHTKEDPSGTAPQMLDSTSNNRDGTSAGGMTSGDLVNAKIHKGLDFAGEYSSPSVVDRIYYSNGYTGISGSSAYSISFWCKFESLTGGDGTGYIPFSEQDAYTRCFSYISTSGFVRFRRDPNVYHDSATGEIVAGNWYLLHFVKENNSSSKIYKNGSVIDTDTNTGTTATATSDMILAAYTDLNTTIEPLDGIMEEFRIMSSAVDADWALTDYNNQNSPSTFYSVGNETVNSSGTSTNSERGAEVTGSQSTSNTRDAETTGHDTASSDRSAEITGQSLTNISDTRPGEILAGDGAWVEHFTTTTYKDNVNTTASWTTDGTAEMSTS